METTSILSYYLLLGLSVLIVPFTGALITATTQRGAAKKISIIFAAITLGITLAIAWCLPELEAIVGRTQTSIPVLMYGNVEIFGFAFDRISTLLAPAFVGIGLLVLVYSMTYLSDLNREHADPGQTRFFVFMIIFIGAMAGLVYSSTLIGLLIFFEITGACSCMLIGYYETEQSDKSALKALIVTHIASLGLYLACGALFYQTGSFRLDAIAQLTDGWKTFVLVAILFAAWGKSAQLPLYMWLPSAMAAPTPVSAYLHGASMVKVGVYIFARAVYEAGIIPETVAWIALVGAILTLIFSFLMYLPQKDMKRLLAFSTISQLSYIFLAISLAAFGSHIAFNGAISHIFNHAFAKTLFFLVAGALSYSMGTRMLDKMSGLLKKSKILGMSFIIAGLAISGVPPFNGFFSKFQIFAGGFEIGSHNIMVLITMILVLIETISCFAWFLMWIGKAAMGEPSETVDQAIDIPKSMKLVFAILCIMTVASSFIAANWLI